MPAPIKVLLLTPQTPFPPDQGAPIRNFSFVRYLGQDPRYELSLLSFARPGEDPVTSPALTELAKYCRQVKLVAHPPRRTRLARLRDSLLSPLPDLAKRLASPRFEAALANLLQTETFDVIQCEGLEMAPFGLRQGQGLAARLVLDEHNAEYLLQRRIFEQDWQSGWKRRPAALYSWLQARRLARYERAALGRFDRAIAVSEPDRAALAGLGETQRPIAVIPNGIDLSEFSPENSQEEPASLVFTGTMDFRPNVDAVCWFAGEVWPLILAHEPEACFYIVGRRPAPAVAALQNRPGIEVTGTVPDARPYVRRSALYIVPMRMGGGVRFKVLDAMALGKAIVTTGMGADGIDLTAGQEAVVADTAQDFAGQVVALLNDPARRRTLAQQGRRFVEENFDWRKITPLLDDVLAG
jgi:sugar transferase (PEP-CTERM/EpsH1 system associated)